MKTQGKMLVMPLSGINQKIPQDTNSATQIINFSTDEQTDGWDNRIGYEPYAINVLGQNTWGPYRNSEKITSCFYWPTHGGAKSFMLYESNQIGFFTQDTNQIRYIVGNDGGTTPVSFESIDTQRTRPAQNQLGSYFEPFGKELVIINGTDRPIVFNGDRVRTLGFATSPNPPVVWQPLSGSTEFNKNAGDVAYNPIEASPTGSAFLEPASVKYNLYYGLGTRTDGKDNQYRYKVSYVMDNGSESPISARSAPARWLADDTGLRQGLWLENIPTGPDGVVSRRLYRTRNLGDNPTNVGTDTSAEDEVYFFLDEIKDNECTHYFDIRPDSALGFLAPRDDHSVLFPAGKGNVAATFKNCLFMNGGEGDGYTLYYSKPLKPDQFGALDFFQAGNQNSGDIIGLKGYYNSLLVFRERGIDIVIGNPLEGFQYVPYIKGIGCSSRFGIVEVPELGIMFLSEDGIYLLQGGLDGGAKLTVKKMTNALPDLFSRLNKTMLPKAVAGYSSKRKEVHFYFTIDGAIDNNIGLVYHLDRQGFSKREGFPVSCLTNDLDGNLIFGHQSGYTVFNNDTVQEAGLYFISGCGDMGTAYQGSGDTGVIKRADGGRTSTYQSATHDFGYGPQKKFIKYVYLYVRAMASQGYKIKYYLDRNTDTPYVIDSKDLFFQRPEQTAQAVYGGGAFVGGGTFDASKWEHTDLIQVRFPVAQKACSYFSFELETTGTDTYSGNIVLVGYSLEFNTNNTKTRSGRTNAL